MKQHKWIVGPAVLALAFGSSGVVFAAETETQAAARQGQQGQRPEQGLTETQRQQLRQALAERNTALKAARDTFRKAVEQILGDRQNDDAEEEAPEQQLTEAQVQALRAAVKARKDAFAAAHAAYRQKVAAIRGSNRPAVTVSAAAARAATDTIELHFRGNLKADTASNAANYTVKVNDVAVAVESAGLRGNKVSLGLADGVDLKAGDRVVVAWAGLKDALNRDVAGNTTITVR